MFNSPALEVALGLMFLFLCLSLLASALSEVGAALFQRRERFLKIGIENLVGLEPALGGRLDRLYAHPRIRELVRPPALGTLRKTERLPASIPAPVFSSALLDVLTDAAASDDQVQHGGLVGTLSALPAGHSLRAPIQRLVGSARQDLGAVRAELEAHRPAIEEWYCGAMHRVREWYGLQVRWILLGCGIVMAAAFNVDTFAVAKGLWGDPALRQATVVAADRKLAEGQPTPPGTLSEAVSQVGDLNRLALPMGWKFATGKGTDANDLRRWPGTDWNRYPAKLLGLLVTALAVMLGAPFWFDLLSKVANLRATGRASHEGGPSPSPSPSPPTWSPDEEPAGGNGAGDGGRTVTLPADAVEEPGEPLPDPIPIPA